MSVQEQLKTLRAVGGQALTQGLDDDIIARFAERDASLVQALDEAVAASAQLKQAWPDLFERDESAQIDAIQRGFVNFYPANTWSPYVAIAARGPWVVTSKGAVLHDSGGYGMLGHGHAPQAVLDVAHRPQVMANIMTSSFSQHAFIQALRAEVGHNRANGCPFDRFLCVNSGSEAVTVATRISDINAKQHTDQGGAHAGQTIKVMSLQGGFHGRTDRPAQFSDSGIRGYRGNLASFRDRDNLITIEPNNLEQLQAAFDDAAANNVFIESFFIEPVMGEGDPGLATTPEFYALARKLTREHGSLLLVDSIQAGLRARGCLSVVDYPGFETLDAPDLETYSKALNAGQYPLSVLALNDRAAAIYKPGLYGNTMTSCPRATDIGTTVLQAVTDALRDNINQRGEEFLQKFRALADELDGQITKVQGAGLLFSVELNDRYVCCGDNSVEQYMRRKGIGVIHGGANSLRFTPHFNITSAEVDLIVDATREAILNGPQRAA